ncbi:toprim domain-containing protein [Acidiphilium sp.]|uniref:DUF7146 domain-containing protein n=1 Tax=Acidiphilium sp. TaxID=527 RepID=UPI00258EE313|nr:toprim domain-containing protein [Acidiphilium sp.]
MFQSASDAALRLSLRHVPGRREWRGACPSCGYNDSFMLSEKNGRAFGWCASCQDRDGIARLLRSDAPLPDAHRDPARDAEKGRQLEHARAQALRIWNGAEPAAGTPADLYLTSRGLPGLAASAALRFRRDCWDTEGGRRPALVALVVDAAGEPMSVHRTFLTPTGEKADCEPVKASKGPVWGGAIRLDPAAPELVIGEGIETSASAGRLIGLPAWAAVSAGNLARGLVLPAEVRCVIVAADADEPGERAAREAALRWQREGRTVRIARPDVAGYDFNDVLRAGVAEVQP